MADLALSRRRHGVVKKERVPEAPPARHIEYTDAQRELANEARKAMSHDVLYHGTRYSRLILTTGMLLRARSGERKVCFTRSPEVAAYWALLKRDDDEYRGAILVLDRNSLERAYAIQIIPGPFWHTRSLFHDEAEEAIWDDVSDLARHLIGLVRERELA